ncbi:MULTISPECIES: hypothetical protein [Arcicella]|uniref:Uncharacterized protein n=3 Tax=Arcicella TaxID=217140 RepID=A0A841EV07_9BACT|nr:MULTISPECIES: hypothetical protein [Arcicella]MBB6003281.1 hypothetical protein [Arcicella rosea]MEA5403170.1 hypothetical protein [Arcicella sp. DC2W]MEA5424974.1 hypothetical protein [Arcicella sp. DC25W]
MLNPILGIGSRIRHTDYGDGVVVNVKSNGYVITFTQTDSKEIKFDYPLEIIEEVERDNDLVTYLMWN